MRTPDDTAEFLECMGYMDKVAHALRNHDPEMLAASFCVRGRLTARKALCTSRQWMDFYKMVEELTNLWELDKDKIGRGDAQFDS